MYAFGEACANDGRIAKPEESELTYKAEESSSDDDVEMTSSRVLYVKRYLEYEAPENKFSMRVDEWIYGKLVIILANRTKECATVEGNFSLQMNIDDKYVDIFQSELPKEKFPFTVNPEESATIHLNIANGFDIGLGKYRLLRGSELVSDIEVLEEWTE